MGGAGASILQLVTSGVNLGVLGWMAYLFVGGKLHSDDEMTAVRKDLETTQAALERTREALMLANARSETGALSAEIIAQALGVSRRERRDEDDTRRRVRHGEDDALRSRRRGEDEQRASERAAEDDWMLCDAGEPTQREGRAHVQAEEGGTP